MSIDFNPEINGFQFSNNFIEWSFGPLSGKMLCGGMIYAALDYFIAGMPIPRQQKVPALKTPIQNYIYKRQWTAHKNTAYKFTKYWLKKNSYQEVGKLNQFIDSGQAIPICLYKNMGVGHHVLGISGSSGKEFEFEVYDPNFPNVVSHIKADNEGFRHSINNYLWKGFFIDDGYRWKKPFIFDL